MNKAAGGPGVGSKVGGYTILETMIFLVVSAALFVSAMTLVNGRQGKAEFSTGEKDLESTLQSSANDIADGYYANGDGNGQYLDCKVVGSVLSLGSTGSNNQGGNGGCIVIGKAIQFAPQNLGKSQMKLITLFGRQYINGSAAQGDSQSINDSGVYPGAPGTPPYNGTPDASETVSLANGVTIECAMYVANPKLGFNPMKPTLYQNPCTNPSVTSQTYKIDTIAFMTTFHGSTPSNESQSGSGQVDMVIFKQTPTSQTNIGRTTAAVVDELLTYQTDTKVTSAVACDPTDMASNICANPPGGVFICVQSGRSNQHALINIGGDASNDSTVSAFDNGGC